MQAVDGDRGDSIRFGLAAALLTLAVVAGGGQGFLGDTASQVLALVLIASCLPAMSRSFPRAAWVLLPLLAVPLLQLLPVPEFLWRSSPARAEIVTQLASAGVPAPSTWALIPSAAERALLWLVPGAALFLCTLLMAERQRRYLMALLLLLAAASVVIGIAQLGGGPSSPLRLYQITNEFEAVGFFANRNHLGGLLAALLPAALLAVAWLVQGRLDGRRISALWLVAAVGWVVLLMLGIVLARSRAGWALGLLGIALSVPTLLSLRRRPGTRRILAGVLILGVLVGLQFGLSGVLKRFDNDQLEEGRIQYARVTFEAAAAHAPLGSGLGTFRPAYQPFESDTVGPTIINHAHSDAVELWLEARWLAVLAALPLVGAFVLAGRWIWRKPESESAVADHLLARAAWLGLALIGLHSLVDYPLRTTAMLAVAGVLAGLVVPVRATATGEASAGRID